MSLLAPPLNRLIDAAERFARGESSADEVRSLLPGARGFLAEGRGLFRLISPGILRTTEVERLLDECVQDMDSQEEALASLEAALGEGSAPRVGTAAGRLRDAATRLARGYGGLHEEEQKEKIYTPFPVLDHFLKVGLNVLEGQATRADLAERFPPVVALVERLGRDVDRFAALYESPEVSAQTVREFVGTLQAGLGALVEYFENDTRSALADALKLLGRGSAALHEGLVEMDGVASKVRGGRHPYLAELRLALERGLPWPLVQDAWSLVTAAEEHYRTELDAFRRFPLSPFLEAEEAQARAALDATAAALARLDFTQPGRPDLSGLDGPFDALSAGVARLWERLEEELARYREAPHLEELRERVGRALLGEPSEELLRERLAHFHEVQRALAAEAAGGGLPPDLAAELTGLFAGQDAGYQVMLASIPSRDLRELRRGWELLEATMPRMLELARGMREAISARREAAPAGVTCMRCGRKNAPGTRYCAGCNAILPALGTAPAEETDILGGEPAAGPTRLSRLEGLIAGAAEASEILAEVASLQDMAGQIAGRLRQQGGTGAEGEFASFFHERVEAYLQGLGWIQACAESGDTTGMWQGLEACRAAEEDIADLKREIDAAL